MLKLVAAVARTTVLAGLLLVFGGSVTPSLAQGADPASGEAIFNLFANSSPAGVERVNVEQTGSGWRVSSTGQFFPLDLENLLFQIEYDQAWQPQTLSIDATRGGEAFSLETTFADGIARSELVEGYDRRSGSLEVPATAVVLPDYFFGAFEVLASRLADSAVGDEIPIFTPPITRFTAVVDELAGQEIRTVGRAITARIYRLTFRDDDNAVSEAEVWVDQDDRLLRVSLPRQGIELARQDVVLVSTRLNSARVPGDAEVRVAASGFSLAAAVTTPLEPTRPREGWPAVVLVPGTRSVDRDEQQFGVPLFANLAEQLTNAGYLVVRYDKRGVGRSGGRPESASLEDYADDVRTIVRYLDRRDDVDDERIVVLGHGEGGWVALRAAAEENRIDGLVLIAVPATSGTALVLEQQRAELDGLGVSDSERVERIALQTQIHEAVLGSGSWEGIPDRIRRQANTAWFRSFLMFEPMEVMRRTRQPVLILHGAADTVVPAHHADRLEELAAVRTRDEATVRTERLPDVDHVLRRIDGDGADEAESGVTQAAISALTDWLASGVRPRK